MEWKAEYATGIPEIDLQHKTLLQFITDFERAVRGEMHWNTVQPLVVRAREFESDKPFARYALNRYREANPA